MRTFSSVVIAAGAQESSAIYLGTDALVGVLLPAVWTKSKITFQGSVDGTNYCTMHRTDDQIEYGSMEASEALGLDSILFRPFPYIKVVAETTQVAAATIVTVQMSLKYI